MEEIIVAIIIICAVAYLIFRAYTAIKDSHNPCKGCDGCVLNEKNRHKRNKLS